MNPLQLRRAERIAGATTVLFGFAGLLGGAFALPGGQSLLSGIGSVRTVAAVCFVLVGLAFYLRTSNHPSVARRVALICAALVACMSFTVLTQQLFGWLPAEALPVDKPSDLSALWGMRLDAALGFLCLGIVLLILPGAGVPNRAGRICAGLFSVIAALLGLFAVLVSLSRLLYPDGGERMGTVSPLSGLLFILLGAACTVHAWRDGGLPLVIDNRLLKAFGVGLAVFAVSGFGCYESTRRLALTADWVRHTHEVLAKLQRVNAGLTGEQLYVSSFLLKSAKAAAGESVLRESLNARNDVQQTYRELLENLQSDIIELRRLTSDNQRQQTRIQDLDALIRQRVSLSEQTLGLTNLHVTSVSDVNGQDISGKIHGVIGALEHEEDDQLKRRELQAQLLGRVTFVLLPTSALIGIGMLLAGLTFLNSEAHRSHQAEAPGRLAKEIVRSTDDAVITKTLKGIITSWNPGAEKIFGYSAAEAIGQSILLLIPPERHGEETEILARVSTGQRIDHFETVRVRKDGSRANVWVTTSPLRDASGEVIGASKILRDITDRKRAEEALRASEQRLDFALRTSQIGAWEILLADRSVTRTPIHAKIFGYTTAPLPDWSYPIFLEHVLPEDRDEVNYSFTEAVRKQTNWNFECRIRRADGEVRWIWVAGGHEVQSDGNTLRLSGLVQDITERKAADEARRASEVGYRTLFENAPDGILITSPKSTYVDVNPSMCRMLGYSREELLGMNSADILAPAEVEHMKPAREAIRTSNVYHREWKFLRKDGSTFPGDVIATAMPGGDIVGIVRDVTERKNAERDLREKDERIHAADRRLAEILNGMTEACFALDADWRFTFVNEQGVALFKHARQEMLGQSIWQVFPALPGTPIEQQYRRAMTERVPFSFEAFSPAAGRWLDVRVSPTSNGLAAFLLDVDARKRAEQAIATSEARYRRLFESAKDGILILDSATGLVLDVNPSLVSLLGHSPQWFIGKGIWELGFFKDTVARQENFAALQAEQSLNANLAVEVFDGQQISIEFVSNSYLVDEQRIIHCNVRDITASELAKTALRESELRFRRLADSIPQLAWMADADGFIYWYNERWYQYTGTTFEQMEGWGWQVVHDPVKLPEVMDKWTTAIRLGRRFEMEFPLRGADGQFRDFLTLVHPFRDAEGQVIQWFGTNTDVHDLKRMENSLRVAQARLLSTLQAGSIGTWTWDISTNLLIADEFTARMFSIDPEAAERGAAVELYLQAVLPEDQPIVEAGLSQAVQSCGYYDLEYRVRKSNGDLHWLQAKGRVEADAAGNARLFHGAIIDITARRKTEGRFRRLIDSNAHGVMFWNTAGKITGANDACLRTLGYTRQDLDAGLLDWRSMTPPEFADLDSNSLRELATNGTCTPFEKEYIRKDKTHVAVLLGAATFEDSPSEGVCFLLDITERKRQESALRESEEHFRFLDELSVSTRTLSDPESIMAVMTQMLSEHLLASRCAYADVDPDADRFVVLHDYTDGCPSSVGRYQLSLLGAHASTHAA